MAGNSVMERFAHSGNVVVKVRVDGRVVATTVSRHISESAVVLAADALPLSVNSFVELDFFDKGDRFLVPARVDDSDGHELTITYEQVGAHFLDWLAIHGVVGRSKCPNTLNLYRF